MRDFPYIYPYMWNIFHILGIITPTDELIFFRGVGQPPTVNHVKHILLSILRFMSGRAFLRGPGQTSLRSEMENMGQTIMDAGEPGAMGKPVIIIGYFMGISWNMVMRNGI